MQVKPPAVAVMRRIFGPPQEPTGHSFVQWLSECAVS